MNYDSRSTWDSGLDAGSTPARSTNFHKEGPGKAGRIPYEARRRLRTEFAFKCVCSTKVKQVELSVRYYRIRKYMLFSISMEVKITAVYVV